MSRSSARGQVEPLVALVATAAVCLGLGLHAGLLVDLVPQSPTPTVETTAQRAVERVALTGVARPERLPGVGAVAPEGFRLNATLTTGDHRWTTGPTPPDGAPTASRPVPIRTGTEVRPGNLEVVVWS